MSRKTIVVDDDLIEEAKKATGEEKTSRVIRLGLQTLIRNARLAELAAEMDGSGITKMNKGDLERMRER